MRRETVRALKALWMKYWSKVTFSSVIHYTMLQYVCCNGLLVWVVGEMVVLLRESCYSAARLAVAVTDACPCRWDKWHSSYPTICLNPERQRHWWCPSKAIHHQPCVCLSIVRRAVCVGRCRCVSAHHGMAVCWLFSSVHTLLCMH